MIRVWNESKTMYIEYNKYTNEAILCDSMNGILAMGNKDKMLKKLK